PLRAYLYASMEGKQREAGEATPFTLRAAHGEVLELVQPDGEIADVRGEALLMMERAWGAPGSPRVAQAFARFAAGEVHGDDLAAYAVQIAEEERPYTLREILLPGAVPGSPLVRDALGGAWAERLASRLGMGTASRLYRSGLAPGGEEAFAAGLGASWDDLERDWRADLEVGPAFPRADGHPRSETAPRSAADAPVPGAFFRGISFSHEGWRGGGYGSDLAAAELARIRALHADAIAVVP